MNWFSDQIEERKKFDADFLDEAGAEIRAAITGKAPGGIRYDNSLVLNNALDQILVYFRCQPVDIPASISDLEERFEYAFHPNGILWRDVELKSGWYNNACGVFLGQLTADDQYVTLVPNHLIGYSYRHPSTGKKIKLNRATEKNPKSLATCFYKGFPQRSMGIPDLFKYMLQNVSVSTYVLMYSCMLAVTLLGMLTPNITYTIYDRILVSNNLRLLGAISVFMLCISLSTQVMNTVQSILTARINRQLNFNVEAAAMARIFSLKPNFFRQYSAGELATKMGSIHTLCSILINTVFSVATSSLFSMLYFFQIFKYAPCLVFPSIIVTCLSLAYTILNTFMQVKYSEKQMNIGAKNNGMIYALINGVQKIKLAGAEKRVFARWMKSYAEELRLAYRRPFYIQYSGTLSLVITSIGQIVNYYIAVQNHITISQYVAFLSAYSFVAGAFGSLAGITTTFAQIRPVLKMAEPILKAEPENSEKKQIVTNLSGNIELNNISFKYTEDGPYILNNFSLKIKKGQYVAIVGKTGCGKSTLVRMLLGFEKPERGAVYYDGRDINSLDVKSLRRRVGTVMQGGKLFNGDIFSNITIGAPRATLEDAWAAAESAGIAQDIRDMPMGMYTLLTEGQGLSGGQRQRVIIARALAAKPNILIFDEATSALDNLSQRQVAESLNRLKCTRIVIAHRLSTIRECDRIIYLEDGMIKEDGSYEELIALNGKFADLVARQQLDVGDKTA